jgi:hypothetical protein
MLKHVLYLELASIIAIVTIMLTVLGLSNQGDRTLAQENRRLAQENAQLAEEIATGVEDVRHASQDLDRNADLTSEGMQGIRCVLESAGREPPHPNPNRLVHRCFAHFDEIAMDFERNGGSGPD